MNSTRLAWLAAFVECVTIRIVWPSRLISPKSESRLSAAWESSAPVGSSARMICGDVISARATAARCFWPPETSYGYFERMSEMPSFSTIGRRRWFISG